MKCPFCGKELLLRIKVIIEFREQNIYNKTEMFPKENIK